MELRNKYGADINVVTLIGSIRDIKRLDEVFETYHHPLCSMQLPTSMCR